MCDYFTRVFLLWLVLIPVFIHYAFGNHPDSKIIFIENKGQWDPEVKYAADIPGGKLYLMRDRLSYRLKNFTRSDHPGSEDSQSHTHRIQAQELVTMDVEFSGANANPFISAEAMRGEKYNYYLGSDRTKWAEDCRAYEAVTYHGIYDGIDLVLYTQGSSLKYDLIVQKESDPSEIRFTYKGDAEPFLEDGCSFICVGSNTIMEDRPVAYQVDASGRQQQIGCNYQLAQKELSFQLDESYDPGKKLVIDPELIFSTFSGSVSDNFGYTACFDDAGNLYSGGIVFGSEFPSTTDATYGGGTDMAILKYDSSGSSLLYATFIGGDSGDTPLSLIADPAGELIILGTSGSADYPTSEDGYDRSYNGGNYFTIFDNYYEGTDIVVSRLTSSGHLKASTYIGSAGNDGVLKINSYSDYINELVYNYGDYQRGDVILDDAGNIYVASHTDSTGFPVTSSIQNSYAGGNSDAVVFSLDPNLTQLRWSTYLGGTGDDAAYSIKLNAQGHVLVGGGTSSPGFPTTADALTPSYQGGIDGFVTAMDIVNDTITRSTFLGTNAYDQVYFIDIDESQNVYAAGQTRGQYPVTSGVYSNPNSSQFIHKLDQTLSDTQFSTVFGSGGSLPDISLTAFLANDCENIFLSGWGGEVNERVNPGTGNTFGMPVTNDAFDGTTDGSDFYLMVLSADAKELLYATFFGSTNNSGDHVDGGTSRFDKRGIVYQSVCTCGGSDDNFPTTVGAWSNVNRGVNSNGTERCNNAAFKFDLASLKARFETNNADGDAPGLLSGCKPLTIAFTNTSIGGEDFFWDLGDGTTSDVSEKFTHTYENGGEYRVSLYVRDENTCRAVDSAFSMITVFDEAVSIGGAAEICEGSSVQLSASGGGSYNWTPVTGLSDPAAQDPVASPAVSTTYTVEIITPNGCIKEETVRVTVVESVEEDFEVTRTYSCGKEVQYAITNNTDFPGDWLWDFGDGETSTEADPVHTYANPGTYTISLGLEAPCRTDKSMTIEHQEVFIPNVFTPNGDGKNDRFVITSPFDLSLMVHSRDGNEVFQSPNYQNDWDGENLETGIYYYTASFENGEICRGWVQLMR